MNARKNFFYPLVFILTLILPHHTYTTNVKTIDLLDTVNLDVNAAGPFILRMDNGRSRLIAANTLTSSLTMINCRDQRVKNIPIEGRGLQHLKSEAMVFSSKTGTVYLIGDRQFHIIDLEESKGTTIDTEFQFESIAADPATGNVFLAGREIGKIGFYDREKHQFNFIEWLNKGETLTNKNATPPPPIRKVFFDPVLRRTIALDGFESMLYIFHPDNCKLLASRRLPLTTGGRWHLAGYNYQHHLLFVVIETDERETIQAAKIDVSGKSDVVVNLPGYTECAGISYHPIRNEIYIPYDNHPSVHVVSFEGKSKLDLIKVPTYGNDASTIDMENHILYLASWAHGEVDVIDLRERKLQKRITDLGILPHMSSMVFDQHRKVIYFPRGATVVNGTFGSSIIALHPQTEKIEKIYTGWSPIDLIETKERNAVLVFNSEDQFAEIGMDGNYILHMLPHPYPINAIQGPANNIHLSYGPHQSYWPTVYIWGARDGILTIDSRDLSFYDRRIPRQALQMVSNKYGTLYFTQNNWGTEEQFLGILPDGVRLFDPERNIYLGEKVSRETSQRILRYDPSLSQLYLVKTGESAGECSVLQIISTDSNRVIQSIEVGQTATDLIFDDTNIYVSNYDSGTSTIIDRNNLKVNEIETGKGPLRFQKYHDKVYVLNNLDNSIQEIYPGNKTHTLPGEGKADNLFRWRERLIVTSHSPNTFSIFAFHPRKQSFTLLNRERYPYGDTSFHSENVSFFMRGQFGDAVFSLTKAIITDDNRLWITDFLSGKVLVLSDN